MAMLFVTLFVMLLVVGAMSVGVLFGRKPIAGSCGGVGQALNDENYVCDLCGNDESKCKDIQAEGGSSEARVDRDLSYEVTRSSGPADKGAEN